MSFHHLPYQEFLAGVHVCVTWNQTDVTALTVPSTQRLDMVRLYICGMLADKEGHRFLNALSPKEGTTALQSRAEELLLGLAAGNPEQDSGEFLNMALCVMEGRMGPLVQRLEEKMCGNHDLELKEVPGGLMPHQLAALGYWIQASGRVTKLW